MLHISSWLEDTAWKRWTRSELSWVPPRSSEDSIHVFAPPVLYVGIDLCLKKYLSAPLTPGSVPGTAARPQTAPNAAVLTGAHHRAAWKGKERDKMRIRPTSYIFSESLVSKKNLSNVEQQMSNITTVKYQTRWNNIPQMLNNSLSTYLALRLFFDIQGMLFGIRL